MKSLRNTLFLAILCASPFFSNAQVTDFGIGIRGGANFSKPTSLADAELKPGYYVGLYKRIKLIPALSLQPELQYSSQGYKTSTDNATINYLAIPVLAKLKILMVSVETGPQFNFKLNDKFTTSDPASVSPDFSKYETNWVVGASFHFPVIGLAINARYINSFNTMTKEVGFDGENQLIQLGLAFQI